MNPFSDKLTPKISNYYNFIIHMLTEFDNDHYVRCCFFERFLKDTDTNTDIKNKLYDGLCLKAFKFMTDLIINIQSPKKNLLIKELIQNAEFPNPILSQSSANLKNLNDSKSSFSQIPISPSNLGRDFKLNFNPKVPSSFKKIANLQQRKNHLNLTVHSHSRSISPSYESNSPKLYDQIKITNFDSKRILPSEVFSNCESNSTNPQPMQLKFGPTSIPQPMIQSRFSQDSILTRMSPDSSFYDPHKLLKNRVNKENTKDIYLRNESIYSEEIPFRNTPKSELDTEPILLNNSITEENKSSSFIPIQIQPWKQYNKDFGVGKKIENNTMKTGELHVIAPLKFKSKFF